MIKIKFYVKFVIISLALFIPMYSYGYIGTVFHLYNPQTGQHVFLLGDCHYGKSCGSQRKYIIQAVQELDAVLVGEDMLMDFPRETDDVDSYFALCQGKPYQRVVEDILKDPLSFDPNKNYFALGGPVGIDLECPLFSLMRACHRKSIPVINVECRQLKELSECGLHISGRMVCQHLQRILAEINTCNDNEQLNSYYKFLLQGFNACRASLLFKTIFEQDAPLSRSFFEHGAVFQTELCQAIVNLTLQNMVNTMSRAGEPVTKDGIIRTRQALSQKLTALTSLEICKEFSHNFFVFLIDARILHEVYALRYRKNVVVCAGAAHIEEVAAQLLEAGYHIVPDGSVGANVHAAICNPDIYEPVDIQAYFDRVCYTQYMETPSATLPAGNHSVLREALRVGDSCTVARLINYVNSKGTTGLMRAVRNNDKNLVLQLINHGARTDIKDHVGMTALAWACGCKRWDIVRVLARAMPRNAIDIEDNSGATPLVHAVLSGCDECVVHDLVNNGATVNKVFLDGWTPLDFACASHGMYSAIRALIARGADPNVKDGKSLTPLIRAAVANGPHAPLIIKYLCCHGANVCAATDEGDTALKYAIYQDNAEVVRELIKFGACICTDPKGEALAWEVRESHPEIARIVSNDLNEKMARFIQDSRTLFIHM